MDKVVLILQSVKYEWDEVYDLPSYKTESEKFISYIDTELEDIELYIWEIGYKYMQINNVSTCTYKIKIYSSSKSCRETLKYTESGQLQS